MRTAADLVRDAIALNEAREIYRENEIRLRRLATDARLAGRPLTGRIHLGEAALCRRAALAELVDPEPRE